MHVRIAGAIKRARGKRSAQWLADRTAELGYPITRAQIANYESGRKQSLDIAELIVVAAALDMSPVTLVYPGPYEQGIELLPGVEASEFEAAQWFSGLGYWWVIAGSDDEAWRTAGRAWVNSMRTLRAHRQLQEAELMRAQVMARGDFDRDRDQIVFYDRRIEQIRQELIPDRNIGDA